VIWQDGDDNPYNKDLALLDESNVVESSLSGEPLFEKKVCYSHQDEHRDSEISSSESDFESTHEGLVPTKRVAIVQEGNIAAYHCVVCERERLGITRLSFHSFPNVKTEKANYG